MEIRESRELPQGNAGDSSTPVPERPIRERLLHAAIVGSFSADNESYCCNVTIRDAREAVEAMDALAKERDEWKALASVGTWHSDCRPNRKMAAEALLKQQAVIDKLADTIANLNQRLSSQASGVDGGQVESPMPNMPANPDRDL